MLKIGSLELPSPFVQAPMAGFSNDAWRRILLKFGGVGLLASEMMHARGSLEMERRRKTLHGRLFGLPSREKNGGEKNSFENPFRAAGIPLSVQIWDNQPEPLAEFAEKLVLEYDIQVIDMNFGCPAPDVVQKARCGSWLLQFPERIAELAEAVVQAVHRASSALGLSAPIPVTAKMRLGLSSESMTYASVAQALESAGVSAVTVHGRTTRQMYSGKADWEKIAEIKSLLHVPVIGNGDIRSAFQANEALRKWGVDGVMIGRAALNEPWLFRDAFALYSGADDSELLKRPAAEFQKRLLLEHFDVLLEQHEETEAVMLMRKFAPCYGVGLPNARQFRVHVTRTRTAAEFRQAIEEYFPRDNPEAS
ncbi:MAG: tRNA-dihydrouridine synthase [Planctomycetaceae bacterium]|nr:tRNA-dihydrouridine synthase [Planctomycetaceae bacterium]